MLLDHTAQILLFQSGRIKTGQEHIVNDQQINFPFFEIVCISAPRLLILHIVENQDVANLRISVQFLINHPGLIRRITDDHAANGGITQRDAAVLEIIHNIVYQRCHILWVRIDIFLAQ